MSFCQAIEFAHENNMLFTIDDSRWFLGRWADYFCNDFIAHESLDSTRFYRKHIGQKQFNEEEYEQYKRLPISHKHSEKYNYFLKPSVLSVLQNLYRYNLEFAQVVEDSCSKFSETYDHLVAFHIRLGDKVPQHKMGLAEHLEMIQQQIQRFDLNNCDFFLMTDDYSIHPQVCDYFGKDVLLHKLSKSSAKMLRFEKGHLGDLLIEIEIASRAKAFISSLSETSRLVRAYRRIKGKQSPIDYLPI